MHPRKTKNKKRKKESEKLVRKSNTLPKIGFVVALNLGVAKERGSGSKYVLCPHLISAR